jgi:hypothetical protein
MIGLHSFLLILATYTAVEIRRIMATLQEIKTTGEEQSGKLDVIGGDVKDVSRKVDILIVQGSAGGNVDQVLIDQIAETQTQMTGQIDTLGADVTSLEGKVDSALGPHVEPHHR